MTWMWYNEPKPAAGDSRGYLYRYIDYQVAGFSHFGDWDVRTDSHTEISCEKFRILKRTPKGAWIYVGRHLNQEKKFVNLTCHKQWAYIGKSLALRSFIARKNASIRIYEARIKGAKGALARAAKEKPWDKPKKARGVR